MMTAAFTAAAVGHLPLSAQQTMAVLVHELRQPLATITAALEMQKRSLSAERRQRAGEVIEQQVLHLSRLLESALEALPAAAVRSEPAMPLARIGDADEKTT